MPRGIVLTRSDDRQVTAELRDIEEQELPAGNVTVAVEYSTLNYKDGLVLTGQGNLAREYPHVPGIDFAGRVTASEDARYQPGDAVVLTGWHVGERHWGGYATAARVDADWLVPLPAGLSTYDAMAIGTAGFTAALGLSRLEAAGLSMEQGPVLVTGAAGGVGSIGCALLAKRGYTVAASTGRAAQHAYLESLGASEIIARDELANWNGKPLNKERWAGCIDSVGGSTLATVLSELRYGGGVAAIGLAGGTTLKTTVIPFLLRGNLLLGIDSVRCPYAQRLPAWQMLAEHLSGEALRGMSERVSLAEVIEMGPEILAGRVRGRIVVDVNA